MACLLCARHRGAHAPCESLRGYHAGLIGAQSLWAPARACATVSCIRWGRSSSATDHHFLQPHPGLTAQMLPDGPAGETRTRLLRKPGRVWGQTVLLCRLCKLLHLPGLPWPLPCPWPWSSHTAFLVSTGFGPTGRIGALTPTELAMNHISDALGPCSPWPAEPCPWAWRLANEGPCAPGGAHAAASGPWFMIIKV